LTAYWVTLRNPDEPDHLHFAQVDGVVTEEAAVEEALARMTDAGWTEVVACQAAPEEPVMASTEEEPGGLLLETSGESSS
jgi:hypothetical protein